MGKSLKKVMKFVTLFFFFVLTKVSSSPIFPPEAHPTKSGYLPVSTTTNSSLFYVFYEFKSTTVSHFQTPILVWLQGGPGCSSMVGNFFELGPYLIHNTTTSLTTIPLKLTPNPYSWNTKFGLVFIDNPIGTGFSTAASSDEIPTDQIGVARHLWLGLQHFLDSEIGFRARPLYLAGESYAGKYIPAAGWYVLKMNEEVEEEKRIGLKGVAIGNGLTDPVVQVKTHADSAYYNGLINAKQREKLKLSQERSVELAKEAKWPEATDARNLLFKQLENMTGLATLYDFRRKTAYETDRVEEIMQDELVKEILGVNKNLTWYECSYLVGRKLHGDIMKSVKPMVEVLLEKSKVLLYQGQFDLKESVVSTEAWVNTLEWKELHWFLTSNRSVWKVDGDVAGYVQKWKSLTTVVVGGAGHLVPADQGRNSQAMIEGWIEETGFFAVDIKIKNIDRDSKFRV